MVWDRLDEGPAEARGAPLIGLRKEIATGVCEFFNRGAKPDGLPPRLTQHLSAVGA
jgi:hypothetical protein